MTGPEVTAGRTHANARRNAIRLGIRRGTTEFLIALRTPSEVAFMALGLVVAAVVLVLTRDTLIPGSSTPVALFVVASALAVQIAFVSGYNIAVVLSTEREDGTLLRAKSLPFGIRAYSVGLAARALLDVALSLVTTVAVALVVLGAQLQMSPLDVAVLVGVVVVGLAALAPFGFVIGSVIRSPRAVGGWGFLVIAGLTLISGLIIPLVAMPGWVQVVGQGSPLYWIGLGLRSAFLPEEFAAGEIGGSWRLPLVFVVLLAWAVVGWLCGPFLLGRAARRESGSIVEARRQAALQRV